VKPYRFLEEADAEFHEQIAYFDEQAGGLGDRFVADVEATVAIIREYPESGSKLVGTIRKRVLRVFRYNVLYAIKPDEIIIGWLWRPTSVTLVTGEDAYES
jgi:ParE toxin of type II toxin-antitoxin system, parDE